MEEKIIKLENWRNLFNWSGWKKEIIWIIIIILLLYTYWAYKKDMEICLEIANNPCEYCYAKIGNEKAMWGGRNLTKSFFNISIKEENSSLNASPSNLCLSL